MEPSRAQPRRSFTDTPPPAPHYDFDALLAADAELRAHLRRDASGTDRLDLSSRDVIYALSRAILRQHFDLRLTLPSGQLVPTIPNRVQYLTWAAGLLGAHAATVPHVVVDIGTGPSCVYAMLGARMYPAWRFVATDTDEGAAEVARRNVRENALSAVEVRHAAPGGEMLADDVMESAPSLTVCNPPFHASLPTGEILPGTQSQLVTEGGEYAFLCQLANESTRRGSVVWFTSLVGRKVDLPRVVAYLRSPRVSALYVRTVELSQGGRTTRWAVAWSFGEERTAVCMLEDHGSKWRLLFSVRPGRQYANQLHEADITSCFLSVLVDMGWSERDEAASQSECGAMVSGPREGSFDGTILHIHVTPGGSNGEFRVHLKVTERGTLTSEGLLQLGSSVVTAVSDLFNSTRLS